MSLWRANKSLNTRVSDSSEHVRRQGTSGDGDYHEFRNYTVRPEG